MTLPTIQVIGVGLSGASSLVPSSLEIVTSATLLVGSRRLVSSLRASLWPTNPTGNPSKTLPECWILGEFTQVFTDLRARITAQPNTRAVVVATGDPLFFGLGRLLLSMFPPEQLVFHPQVSAIQLAFSRLKVPWQDATLVSVHGRGESLLIKALKQGKAKIAVLTDGVLTPTEIARLITALSLPISYRLWVCENLGGHQEKITAYNIEQLTAQSTTASAFSALNVVVLLRETEEALLDSSPLLESPLKEGSAHLQGTEDSTHNSATNSATLPLIGLPDAVFRGYVDRPTLMTKREIRLLILGAIAPRNHQVIWDIGAGTGSVSIELSRLCPQAQIYAIEKTATGATLIAQNAKKLAIAPIQVVQGQAPDAIKNLPPPDRVFIGGSSGQLIPLMNEINKLPTPRIVIALATLEHIAELTTWLALPDIKQRWHAQLTQANISRSLPVGTLTRFSPLNPVTIVTLTHTNSATSLANAQQASQSS